jgi:thiamine pyrophosphate-dependent acetolactate synthase large subunit-like protein
VRRAGDPGDVGEQLDDAIARALAHDGPALVEVMSDPQLI